MKTYYELLTEKSKQVRGKLEDIKNDVYWKDDAIEAIWGVLSSILVTSGFLEDPNFSKNVKKELDEKSGVNGVLKIIEEMINKPSEQWRKKGEKIEPIAVAYRLKDALEDLKNAIMITRDAKELNQEQIRRIEGTDSPGAKAFNVYLNRFKEKTNGFFKILNGRQGIESYKSREEGIFIQYMSLSERINGLLYVISPIANSKDLSKDKAKEIDSTLEKLDAIQGRIKGNLEELKSGDRINVTEYQKKLTEQTRKFNHIKDGFFDDFKEFMVMDGRNKSVNDLIASAEKHLAEVDELIENSKDAKKMFKGVDRKSDLYKHIEQMDRAADKASASVTKAVEVRKGIRDEKELDNLEGTKEKSNFNTRTIEIDNQLKEIFNRKLDTGKVKAHLDKLDKLLGIGKE